jgi:hypothetical protein
VQSKITLQCRAFELPLPCAETGRDCQRDSYGSSNEIEVTNGCQNGLLPPDGEDVEDSANDEKGNGKMNENRMLRMPSQKRGLQIERIQGIRMCKKQFHELSVKMDVPIAPSYFFTTIVPVIFG